MPAEAPGGGAASVLTPPLGSPSAIHAAASRISGLGPDISALGSTARASRDDLVGRSWTGTAADAFGGFAGQLSSLCGALPGPASTMSRLLTTYASALETAQRGVTDAAARYHHEIALINQISTRTGSDPNRTEADVAVAQAEIDAADRRAQQCVDDASTAWDTFDSVRADVVSQAHAAAGEVAGDPAGAALEERTGPAEQARGWNDAFGSVWVLAQGDFVVDALVKRLAASGWPEYVAGLRSQASILSSKASALDVLKSLGRTTAGDDAELAALLSETERIESAIPSASRMATAATDASGALGVLRTGAGVLAIFGDAWTVVDPAHDGARGTAERTAAAVNGGLIAANLLLDEIPVVGEVVMVGTGLYLAGDWLYDHWTPFHDVCDDIGNGVSTAWDATSDAVSSVAGDVADGVKGAWDTVSGWF